MPACPWCGRSQQWSDEGLFEGTCPHCAGGVDDDMDYCPWCGGDATGADLIRPLLRRVNRLLAASRVPRWSYRVLLRPGSSGVDPASPDVVEICESYVVGKRRDEIPDSLLVGLILHELGHSLLFRNWSWTRRAEFIRTFGRAEKAYRVIDRAWARRMRPGASKAAPDFVSRYAATHPLEDFAEVFRVYVARRARMRSIFAELGRRRKGVALYEKFLVLERLLRPRRRRSAR